MNSAAVTAVTNLGETPLTLRFVTGMLHQETVTDACIGARV
jgi:hypothetical protein